MYDLDGAAAVELPARDAQQFSLRLEAEVVRELKVTIEMSLQISKDR
jgi:hypothetical protein